MNKVKTIATNTMDKVRGTYEKGRNAMYGLMAAVATSSIMAPMFCPDTPAATGDDLMKSVFGQIIGVILNIAKYMGIGITAYAIISWLLAMKDDNADGQSRAIRFVVVGIALAGAGGLLKPILNLIIPGIL